MSPAAVARRLDEVRALWRLTRSLGQARVVGPVEPKSPRDPDRR